MKNTLSRFALYNVLLVIFCVLKYVLFVNFFSAHMLIFEFFSTVLILCVYIKIFTWRKTAFSFRSFAYALAVMAVWVLLSIKLENVETAGFVSGMLVYNLKNFSTYLFIIDEYFMIPAQSKETA